MSDERTIYDQLAHVQQSLTASKDKQNSFGKYSYRSAETIMEALKPLLGDAVVILTDTIVSVGDRYYVQAEAIFNYKGEHITTSAYARECLSKKGMDDAQLTGSCSSYARKYALCGLFLIDDGKHDIDSMDNTKNASQNLSDIDLATFAGFENSKDLAGIVNFWDEIKTNKPRSSAVWRILPKSIKEIIKGAK